MGWTALLHRGFEPYGQNGERPYSDQDKPQWTAMTSELVAESPELQNSGRSFDTSIPNRVYGGW
jgi:hypothetical protein